MQLTFLGTGTSQGVPVIGCECRVCQSEDARDKRLRTSAMIEFEDRCVIIDTGPDFRQQMLRHTPRVMPTVLFTHAHKDHIAGLDDIRAFNFKYRKDLQVYANADTLEALKREFHYVFAAKSYPGVPRIQLHEIRGGSTFSADGVSVIPIDVLHYRMPVLGFRVGNIAYITDANHIPEEEKEKLRDLDILVLNALRKESHISHFSLEEAVAVSRELKPRRTFFTHISHYMGLHAEVSQELPQNMALAYDGLVVDV